MADSPPVAVAVAVDEQEHQTATAATAEQPAPLADDSSSSSSSDVALAPTTATPTDDGTPAPESLAARAEVLLMCRSLDATLAALGGSTRVRYTALDASRTLLVFGANTGSLYVFNRASLELIRLVSSAEIRGAVVRIAISPIDESLVAVATAQHLLVILQLNIHERAQKEKLVYKVEQHKEDIRCLVWSNDPGSFKLFSGDANGDIYMTNVEKAVSLFHTCDLIFRCKTDAVQLQYSQQRLLISSRTQCAMIDFARDKAFNLGNKPRDGAFGACFHPALRSSIADAVATPVFDLVFAARPVKRLWLAKCSTAQVLSTLNYKDSFSAIPATSIQSPFADPIETPASAVRSLNLSFLLPIDAIAGLLISWSASNLVFLDINQLSVYSWHCDLTDIQNVIVCGTTIYVLHTQQQQQQQQQQSTTAPTKRSQASKDNKPDASSAPPTAAAAAAAAASTTSTATPMVSRIDLLSPFNYVSVLVSELVAGEAGGEPCIASEGGSSEQERKWRFCASTAVKYAFQELEHASILRALVRHLPDGDSIRSELLRLLQTVELEEARVRDEALRKERLAQEEVRRAAEEAAQRQQAEERRRLELERARIEHEQQQKLKEEQERRAAAEAEAKAEAERKARKEREEREKRERKERERREKLQKEAALREKRAGLHITDERDSVTLALLLQQPHGAATDASAAPSDATVHAPPAAAVAPAIEAVVPEANGSATASESESTGVVRADEPHLDNDNDSASIGSTPPSNDRTSPATPLLFLDDSNDSLGNTSDSPSIVIPAAVVQSDTAVPSPSSAKATAATPVPVMADELVPKKTRKKTSKKTRKAMIAPAAPRLHSDPGAAQSIFSPATESEVDFVRAKEPPVSTGEGELATSFPGALQLFNTLPPSSSSSLPSSSSSPADASASPTASSAAMAVTQQGGADASTSNRFIEFLSQYTEALATSAIPIGGPIVASSIGSRVVSASTSPAPSTTPRAFTPPPPPSQPQVEVPKPNQADAAGTTGAQQAPPAPSSSSASFLQWNNPGRESLHLPTKRVYDLLSTVNVNDILGIAWAKHANIPPSSMRLPQSQQIEQLQSIAQVLEEWITEFDPLQPFTTRVSYLVDIVTTCFELHISPRRAAADQRSGASTAGEEARGDAGAASTAGAGEYEPWDLSAQWWSELEAIEFIERYHEFLDFARTSYACNQHGFAAALQQLLALEDRYATSSDSTTITTSAADATTNDDNHESSSTPATSTPRAHRHYNWRIMDKRRDLIQQLDAIMASITVAADGGGSAQRLSIDSVLEKLRDRNDVLLTLRYIDRLLALAPLATTKFCLLHFPAILPHNILGTDDSNSSRQVYAAKVYYLSNLMRHHTFYHSSIDLVHRWFELLLLVDPPPRSLLYLDSVTMVPRRNAHLLVWTHRDALLGILENVCGTKRRRYQCNLTFLLDRCREHGFFTGMVVLLCHFQRYLEAIYLALDLDDLASFRTIARGVSDPSIWREIIVKWCSVRESEEDLRHRQSVDVAKEEPPLPLQAGRDTSSPPTGSPPVGGGAAAAAVNSSLDTPYCITESQILCLMLHKIGSAATLELLATVPEFADGLPPDAYVPIIKVGLQTQKRESIYPRLLDGINLYLWSQRATPLPQQLASIKDNEIAQAMQQLQPRAPSSVGSRSGSGGLLSSASLSGATSAASSGSLPTKVAPLPQAVLDRLTNNATPMPRFFEEPNASWGIETRLLQGSCPCCTLPLRAKINTNMNVVVFSCGHAYHNLCAIEGACRLCFSMESVLE